MVMDGHSLLQLIIWDFVKLIYAHNHQGFLYTTLWDFVKISISLQKTIWDFVDKANASEGQQWSRGQVKIPKASIFTVSKMCTIHIHRPRSQ